MKTPKFWLAVLVAGVVGNVLDEIVQVRLLFGPYYAKMESMRTDAQHYNFIIGDFVAILVLAWVMDRVASAFPRGVKGGAAAGFYLGVLAAFPTFHFIFLSFKGYPYSLAWINTIYTIVWYVIAGAVLAAVMKKGEPAAA